MCNWSQPSVLRPKGIQAPFEECTLQKQRFDVDVLKTRTGARIIGLTVGASLSTNNSAIHMHYPSIESDERSCLRDSSYGKTCSNGGSERRCSSPRERTTNWHRLPNELFWEVAKWMCFKHLSVLRGKCNEDLLNLGGAFCIYAWKLLRKKIAMGDRQRKELIQEREEALKLQRSAKTKEERRAAFERFESAADALEQLDAHSGAGVTYENVPTARKTAFDRLGALFKTIRGAKKTDAQSSAAAKYANDVDKDEQSSEGTEYAKEKDGTYATVDEPPEYANVGAPTTSSSQHPEVPVSQIPQVPGSPDLDESLQVHTGNKWSSPGK